MAGFFGLAAFFSNLRAIQHFRLKVVSTRKGFELGRPLFLPQTRTRFALHSPQEAVALTCSRVTALYQEQSQRQLGNQAGNVVSTCSPSSPRKTKLSTTLPTEGSSWQSRYSGQIYDLFVLFEESRPLVQFLLSTFYLFHSQITSDVALSRP